MKVYISGPINTPIVNLTTEEAKERFNRCEKWILDNKPDWEPVNPLKVETSCREADCGPFDGHSWECWLKADLIAMLQCEAIVLLPNAAFSRGAQLESYVAKALGMKPYVAFISGEVVL